MFRFWTVRGLNFFLLGERRGTFTHNRSIYNFKFDYFASCESSEALIFQWILISNLQLTKLNGSFRYIKSLKGF